jgi:hypothetical protein
MDNKAWSFFLIFLAFLVSAGLYANHLEIENGITPGGKNASHFEVVAYYNNCDVIRYTPPGDARYAYLLDCTTR